MKNGAGDAPPRDRPEMGPISLPQVLKAARGHFTRPLPTATTQKSGIELRHRMPYVDYDEVGAACAECGRLFRSADDLEAHRRETHVPARTGAPQKPKTATLPCSLCSRKFFSIAALQVHTRRDHST